MIQQWENHFLIFFYLKWQLLSTDSRHSPAIKPTQFIGYLRNDQVLPHTFWPTIFLFDWTRRLDFYRIRRIIPLLVLAAKSGPGAVKGLCLTVISFQGKKPFQVTTFFKEKGLISLENQHISHLKSQRSFTSFGQLANYVETF